MNVIHQSWIDHCKNRYPREFAYPKRIKSPITNNNQLVATIDRWQSKDQPCYVTVYAFDDWHNRPQSAIIDRIYIDLDCENDPQVAIDDAIKLIDGLKRYEIETTQYFSGKKGVAVYIDFEQVAIAPEHKKEVVKAMQLTLMRICGLHLDTDGGTVDNHVIGDINRVSRLPNTKHQSSGLYCIPIDIDDLQAGIDHIRDIAQRPRELAIDEQKTHKNTVMPDYMHRLEKKAIDEQKTHRLIAGLNRLEQRFKPHNGKSKDENIANKLIATLKRTGYLEHNQRVGLVCLLDDLGWTQHEIVKLFLSSANDADMQAGNISRYQVAYTLDWHRTHHR